MSVEENKATSRRVYAQVLDHQHLELADELLASGYVDYHPTSVSAFSTEGRLVGIHRSTECCCSFLLA
jgi:hypothetical protein